MFSQVFLVSDSLAGNSKPQQELITILCLSRITVLYHLHAGRNAQSEIKE